MKKSFFSYLLKGGEVSGRRVSPRKKNITAAVTEEDQHMEAVAAPAVEEQDEPRREDESDVESPVYSSEDVPPNEDLVSNDVPRIELSKDVPPRDVSKDIPPAVLSNKDVPSSDVMPNIVPDLSSPLASDALKELEDKHAKRSQQEKFKEVQRLIQDQAGLGAYEDMTVPVIPPSAPEPPIACAPPSRGRVSVSVEKLILSPSQQKEIEEVHDIEVHKVDGKKKKTPEKKTDETGGKQKSKTPEKEKATSPKKKKPIKTPKKKKAIKTPQKQNPKTLEKRASAEHPEVPPPEQSGGASSSTPGNDGQLLDEGAHGGGVPGLFELEDSSILEPAPPTSTEKPLAPPRNAVTSSAAAQGPEVVAVQAPVFEGKFYFSTVFTILMSLMTIIIWENLNILMQFFFFNFAHC